MMKKYQLIESDKEHNGQKLYQIQALRSFTTSYGYEVKAGDLGGFISGEHNLSQEGNCWVSFPAQIRDRACVSDNGYVASMSYLNDDVQLLGNAYIVRGDFYNNVKIYGNAKVMIKEAKDAVEIFENAIVWGEETNIEGNVKVFGNAKIGTDSDGHIRIRDDVKIYGNAQIEAFTFLEGNAEIYGNTITRGDYVSIQDNVKISGAQISGRNTFKHNVQIMGESIFIHGELSFEENAKIINDDSTQKIEMSGVGCIAGNALITTQNDFIQSNIPSRFKESFTVYKTENSFEIHYRNISFPPEQIRNALSAYAEYEKAISVAKAHILGDI